jgi:hypothetical protein
MGDKDNVQLKVWVSRSCLKNIRTLIQAKYPKYIKGLLSLEVENAINRYTSAERKGLPDVSTHTQITKSGRQFITVKQENSHQRALELNKRVANWLMAKPYEYASLKNVLDKHLKEAIMVVEDVKDKRTLDNRIRLLTSNECIKKNGLLYEFPDNLAVEKQVANQPVINNTKTNRSSPNPNKENSITNSPTIEAAMEAQE